MAKTKKEKDIKFKISTLLKIVAFIMLGISGYIDIMKSEHSILEDPFFIGAFTMAIASILTLINPGIYYIYPAMYFFIFTKLISQYSYSKSYTMLGQKKKFNMY